MAGKRGYKLVDAVMGANIGSLVVDERNRARGFIPSGKREGLLYGLDRRVYGGILDGVIYDSDGNKVEEKNPARYLLARIPEEFAVPLKKLPKERAKILVIGEHRSLL